MTSTTRVAAILGLALIAPLAAACSDDAGEPRVIAQSTAAPSAPPAAPSTGQRTATPAPPSAGTTTASTASTASTAPGRTDLADGVHVARLVRIDPAAGAVTVDVIQFLTGEAATRAAAEDGAELPPPNDYYIRDANSRLRTLPTASGAPITVNVHGAQESGSATKNIPKTLAQLAGIHGVEDGTFRLTLQHGQVIRIAEMYLP
jgi:hypothetical protein